MADLLAEMKTFPRYKSRTQTAYARAVKYLMPSREVYHPRFNIPGLNRLQDMNPAIFVCAVALLDAGNGDDEPEAIRDSIPFRNLIELLGIQKSERSGAAAKNSQRASLVLLEVFTYMVIIHRARTVEEEEAAAKKEARGSSAADEYI